MKLLRLRARKYRSLFDQSIAFSDLNVFIGVNASGKSTILDALRFLQFAVQDRDFDRAVTGRGGFLNLAWKGEEADKIDLMVEIESTGGSYEWTVQLARFRNHFEVHGEDLWESRSGQPRIQLLKVRSGSGWWWSGETKQQVSLEQPTTACALANAAPNRAFPARTVSDFVSRWRFFDPSSVLLRSGWGRGKSGQFDAHGRNLADRLLEIKIESPDAFNKIITATQSVIGLPSSIELRVMKDVDEQATDSEHRAYFVQQEPGLKSNVHQIGASSGTLRMLALMTALFGETESNLIGIEEPENHIHPGALEAFALYLLEARKRVQLLVTTHSPLLLDFIDDPEAVCIVKRDNARGTQTVRQPNPELIRTALDESGFHLGEFLATTGFGG